MFTLTEASRANLEAILDDFHRANRYYPPLYHKRLIPWSERQEVKADRSQWEAFINSESANLKDVEWWQWDGPHPAYPSCGSLCLGMWFGHPDGLQEFTDLVESALCVLQREDFADVDDLVVPFAFGSSRQWLSTLHSWAFRFQMPLLRSDMTLWGAEDCDPHQFIELSERWGRVEDTSYPLHRVQERTLFYAAVAATGFAFTLGRNGLPGRERMCRLSRSSSLSLAARSWRMASALGPSLQNFSVPFTR